MCISFLSAAFDYQEELAIQKSVEQEMLWGFDDEDDCISANTNSSILVLNY